MRAITTPNSPILLGFFARLLAVTSLGTDVPDCEDVLGAADVDLDVRFV
jgi:hypothetical protein